jgi:hypothetical protein
LQAPLASRSGSRRETKRERRSRCPETPVNTGTTPRSREPAGRARRRPELPDRGRGGAGGSISNRRHASGRDLPRDLPRAEPGRRHGYGELYGRRERDYGHRRRPLYGEPAEWRESETGEARSAGFEVESDFPEVEAEGPFTGIGPRGYRRSDERILDDVAERLALNGEVDARDVRLAVNEGEVRLEGSVPSRSLKFMIEDLAASVRGVVDVDNRLRVGRAPERAGE